MPEGTRESTQAGQRMWAEPWQPKPADVQALIERAAQHELGTRYLLHGAQDAVAATFGVHAFVVDAARAHLAGPPPLA